MAEAQVKDFEKRIRQIDRRHNKIARGYVQLVERDGLLVPKTKMLKKRSFPLRAILIAVVGFAVFKGVLVSQVGLTSYEARLESLTEGGMVERAGAWLMQVDPFSRGVAEFILSLS
ncbi:hypothetical protein SAMN04488030_0380 [Aliiroseovarius halocynthiae]|uniref:Uncharacterized protein n=1 Tax=Aliiroseovarius halocynthiae TaxID=985055 RepID=A0A545STT5_9RHOB|nr:hypothetical protein [Aliiroseovarius halocynthiae]TQV68378.1 hypothetical protein FIL88_01945 [Aliiroseovarius halocynthiae]SMR70768.1 hypothetical protein SAMN04488030_0380 [Aliiroseovarius halocynthiae]